MTRRSHRGAMIVVTTLAATGVPALAGSPPTLGDVLSRAAATVVGLEQRLPLIVAREEYQQRMFLDPDSRPGLRRDMVSDVVWVPTHDAMVWAFFRDVIAVDGVPVTDRQDRLESLFAAGPTPAARRNAAHLLAESARHNLGTRRTVNTPVFALSVLHPRNQGRFRFVDAGAADVDGVRVLRVRFTETGRPTLTRTSSGDDVTAHGTLWIEPTRGALVASRLELDVPGLPTRIKVQFRLDPRLDTWLPVEMHEEYGNRTRSVGEQRVEATAKYSHFRSGRVELPGIIPVR